MFSIMAGPRPMSAPAGAIIPSFRQRSLHAGNRSALFRETLKRARCLPGTGFALQGTDGVVGSYYISAGRGLGGGGQGNGCSGRISSFTGTIRVIKSFDDFLAAFRRQTQEYPKGTRDGAGGGNRRRMTGKDITESHWDEFFAFYMETGSRKWGTPYLTRRFFSLIGESMGQHVLLIMASGTGG